MMILAWSVSRHASGGSSTRHVGPPSNGVHSSARYWPSGLNLCRSRRATGGSDTMSALNGQVTSIESEGRYSSVVLGRGWFTGLKPPCLSTVSHVSFGSVGTTVLLSPSPPRNACTSPRRGLTHGPRYTVVLPETFWHGTQGFSFVHFAEYERASPANGQGVDERLTLSL